MQSHRCLSRLLRSFLLFTWSDFKVIIVPHTLVGILSALTGNLLTTNATPSTKAIWRRTPHVLLWNWINLLVFNMANQRRDESIAEDKLNKPWRPIPAGIISPDEARDMLLSLIPASLGISYGMGTTLETLLMVAMTWMYNDLGGGNNHFAIRNGINSLAFALYTYASTLIAANNDYALESAPKIEVTRLGYLWLAMIAAVVFTTLQVQDLPDMAGDQERGRSTIPLVYGETVCRVSVAVNVVLWSMVCLFFWEVQHVWTCFLVLGTSAEIARRIVCYRNVRSDERTFQLWCAWLAILYALPFISTLLAPVV